MGGMIVADREFHGWRIAASANSEDCVQLEVSILLEDRFYAHYRSYGYDTLVIEMAHLHPRHKRSVAQVFDEDELEQLHKVAVRNGFTVLAFPHVLTHRVIHEETGYNPNASDDTDETFERAKTTRMKAAESIWSHLSRYPNVLRACKKWRPRTVHDKQMDTIKFEIRDEVSWRLNVMRPKYDHPDVDRAKQILDEAVPKLSAEEQRLLETYFDVRARKNGVGVCKIKGAQIMPWYCAVFDENGDLRLNDRGQFVGIKFLQYALKMSQFHGKAGTARSNLMYHGQRHREMKAGLGNKELGAKDHLTGSPEADAERRDHKKNIRDKRADGRREMQKAYRLLMCVFRDHG